MWTSDNGLLKRPLHKFFVTDVKEPVTNVKPIGNGLVKSVTDEWPIGNGLLKSVTDHSVLVTCYKVRYR
jgi:hypothetical protein